MSHLTASFLGQIICMLLQTDNHASTSSLDFYRPDALPDAHQQCQSTERNHVGLWTLNYQSQSKAISILLNCHPLFLQTT